MFIRTGLPPRIAKRLLTQREALELRLWIQKNPIDDQSNHHLPIAHLHATVAGLGGSSKKITDFLIFGEPSNDIDSILASNDWGAD